ncbi:OLC1v1006790C1 [Oldenlandia corymbosa var. corymbosa]|uniref:OLC1v1006790C1 n=1 Tax=Oldenlandia corymbosa var. corymbosa TaxID=529605 RepID=A0AAV1DKG5_OLDCO|nr:OLC1v1006790C1 [Oldenlandia corymbosa var. corymbosa]
MYSWFKRNLSRNRKSPIPISSAAAAANSNNGKEEEERFYGITDQLIEFVKSFTVDTFKNFPIPDADVEGGIEKGGDGVSGNVNNDLSEWQERHAVLILSKVKELSQLRFRLCPRLLKEQQFWRIYFTLVWNYVAEYELHAVRLAKLKEMSAENKTQTGTNAVEVEMSEAKPITLHGGSASPQPTEI